MEIRDSSTKVLCTIGPATESEEALRALIEAGMDGARLNFSHAERAWHELMIGRIRSVAESMGCHIAIVADLQGPKIRLGVLPEGGVRLEEGGRVVLGPEGAELPAGALATTYAGLAGDVREGDRILLDDGRVELRVEAADGGLVRCEVLRGGAVSSGKGINLPGVEVGEPSVTDKDMADLLMAAEAGVDYVAVSFVRTPGDVARVKQALDGRGFDIPVIAKIEKPEALDHLRAILEVSDGLMVARGDLGVEVSPERVPVLQKCIIRAANEAGKLVITATQMLESMIGAPLPTRAEATDVANAVYDGTDVLMLSGETAVGRYPAATVRMMTAIASEAEQDAAWQRYQQPEPPDWSFADVIADAVASASENLEADAVFAFTTWGSTALKISKRRPRCPIYGVCTDARAARRAALYRGVVPMLCEDLAGFEEMEEFADRRAVAEDLVDPGDVVLITAGLPLDVHGITNTLKVHRVGARPGVDAET